MRIRVFDWIVLAAFFVALGWIGTEAIAAMGDTSYCPTTANVTQNPGPSYQTTAACSGPCTHPQGGTGACRAAAVTTTNQFPVWKWNATTSKWEPTGTFITSGQGAQLTMCACVQVDAQGQIIGTGNPHFSPCCNLFALEGANYAEPRVAKYGDCDVPNCDPTHPFCKIIGNATFARAQCEGS